MGKSWGELQAESRVRLDLEKLCEKAKTKEDINGIKYLLNYYMKKGYETLEECILKYNQLYNKIKA
jgi:hypothetical protein